METIDCMFSFNQLVKIKKGFYKGYKAKVLKVDKNKEGNIIYEVQLIDSNQKVTMEETNLMKTYKLPF